MVAMSCWPASGLDDDVPTLEADDPELEELQAARLPTSTAPAAIAENRFFKLCLTFWLLIS
jgi:hypothetical protein